MAEYIKTLSASSIFDLYCNCDFWGGAEKWLNWLDENCDFDDFCDYCDRLTDFFEECEITDLTQINDALWHYKEAVCEACGIPKRLALMEDEDEEEEDEEEDEDE